LRCTSASISLPLLATVTAPERGCALTSECVCTCLSACATLVSPPQTIGYSLVCVCFAACVGGRAAHSRHFKPQQGGSLCCHREQCNDITTPNGVSVRCGRAPPRRHHRRDMTSSRGGVSVSRLEQPLCHVALCLSACTQLYAAVRSIHDH
jgi:hypothetical protein